MGESDQTTRPRRKRISNTTTNGIVSSIDKLHTAVNGVDVENGNGAIDNNSSKSQTSGVSNSRSATRRKRIQRAKRRKQKNKSNSTTLIAIGFIVCIISFGIIYEVGVLLSNLILNGAPTMSNSSTTSTNKQQQQQQQQQSEEDIKSILQSKIPNNNLPLTEQQEQTILQLASQHLDRFPISIGTDAGTKDDQDWESILHPGTEALQYFTGNGNRRIQKKKKKLAAKDIASLLSNNKLRGNQEKEVVRDNEEEEEDGYMRVPKLWDPIPYRIIANERDKRSGIITTNERESGVRRYLGNFGQRLMTPVEAKSIGSRIKVTNTTEGDEVLLETIFVAIASYRDYQCTQTIESVFNRATYPQRIRVGVIDQIHFNKDIPCSTPKNGTCIENPNQAICKYSKQIDYLTINSELSVGPVFARHLGHRLYRGEYFEIQSDAHVEYVKGWDVEIIEQWFSAHNEMAILSTYLSGVENHIDLQTGERISKSRPIMCQSDFEGRGGLKHLRHGQQPEGVPYIHDMPTLNPFWAAGFSFGRGHFVVNVPYDQHLPWIFQGEEISIGLRGFSYGYDYYSPERAACYHYYHRKNPPPMFWENSQIYRGSGLYGMNRLNAIIQMLGPSHRTNGGGETTDWIKTDELKYGIGKVRELSTFFDTFGIDVKKQTVEKHLCKFVGQPMQKKFIPALRPNQMGLDYDKINYRFVDPDSPIPISAQ